MKTVLRSAFVCALSFLSLASSHAMSLHAMIYQGRAIELYDTRQLTSRVDGLVDAIRISPNGEYVACMSTSPQASGRVSIVRCSGGRPTVIVSGTGASTDQTMAAGGDASTCDRTDGIAWSPDSKSIATLIVRLVMDKPGTDAQTGEPVPGGQRGENGLLIAPVAGAKRSYFPLPDEVQLAEQLFWAPDGSRLAARCLLKGTSGPDGKSMPEWAVVIVNRNSGYIRCVYRRPLKERVELKGWAGSAKALLCTSVRDGKASLLAVSAEGKGVTDQGAIKEDDRTICSDGTYKLASGAGITIEECATGRKIPITKSAGVGFVGWAAKSTMIMYAEPEELKDETGKRKEMVVRLWLGVPDANKANCMLLAHSITSMPEWSTDASRVAYINEGAVFVAQLETRDADAYEKLNAGIPLSDEEMQDLVASQAKEAGTAMMMYAQDNDGKLPDGSTDVTGLMPYVKNGGIFNMPGGSDGIFHSMSVGNINSLTDPAGTVIGFMDAGRGWIANIYGDGHVGIIRRR